MVLFARGLYRISRASASRCPWLLSSSPRNQPPQLLQSATHFYSPVDSSQKVLGCRVIYSWVSNTLNNVGQQIQRQSSPAVEEKLDPFSLVADELSVLANRLRSMVVAEVPKLASAAEYFFKIGAEGKRFRPTVLLLMATAIDAPVLRRPPDTAVDASSMELRTRQQCIAEITEMIHVRFLNIFHAFLDSAKFPKPG